jgi:tetratricopeptide (TPR) repeat protein
MHARCPGLKIEAMALLRALVVSLVFPIPLLAAETPPPPDVTSSTTIRMSIVLPRLPVASDDETARKLTDAVVQHAVVGSAEVTAADALADQYADKQALQALRECILAEAAAQAAADHRFLEAASYLRHAASLYPKDLALHVRLIDVLLKKGDWPEAESAARVALGAFSRSPDVATGLAYALLRQDRTDEAVATLEDVLRRGRAPAAQALLDRLKKIAAQEKALGEERYPHFTLRYDGQVPEAVGRRVLDLLEEDYSSLAAVLGHQPLDRVPVLLLAKEEYYADAPDWSGGGFNHFDRRIRIPVRGLTEERAARLGGTLKHELTHVFVADATADLAPSELQEGIAQYMEGKRLESFRVPAGAAHAEVIERYRSALSFAEYLIQQGGLATLSFALRETGRVGDLQKGFLAAYNRDYQALQAEWSAAQSATAR